MVISLATTGQTGFLIFVSQMEVFKRVPLEVSSIKRTMSPSGLPIITVEHLGENRIRHNDMPRVSDKDRERLSKYQLRKGDIVFSRVGSVDRRALVRDAEDGWLFSGRCLRVRPKKTRVDSAYLSYFFGLPLVQGAHTRHGSWSDDAVTQYSNPERHFASITLLTLKNSKPSPKFSERWKTRSN